MRQVVKDTVEEVGRVHNLLGRMKAVFTALGTIGIGMFIAFFAPEDLREEIPIYREVGLGFTLFGCLFALALFCDTGPGSIGQRAKSLLLGIIGAAIAAACAVSQLGPSGLVGYALAIMIALFSLFALWEVVTGRPDVTANA